MNTYFLDTSALVKRYVREQGTFWIRNLTSSSQQNTVLLSPITFVEIVSSLSRRQREGTLGTATFAFMIKLVRRHFDSDYTALVLIKDIEDIAENLLVKYPLRAMDALQLASALFIQQELYKANLTSPIFLSADEKLLTIARQVGFKVENPAHYP